jgi:hypothetical protein
VNERMIRESISDIVKKREDIWETDWEEVKSKEKEEYYE